MGDSSKTEREVYCDFEMDLIKHAAYGSSEKHKARFVVCGFSQKEGTDYEETYAPIERYTSIISILALVAMMK